METFVSLLNSLIENRGEKSEELIFRCNELIENPEIPKIIVQHLIENPDDKIKDFAIPFLNRCFLTIINSFSAEEIETFMQNLLILFFNISPEIDISYLLLCADLFNYTRIYPSGMITLLFGSLSDESKIERCALSLPYVFEIEKSNSDLLKTVELINNLWIALTPFKELVLSNNVAALLISKFFKIGRQNIKFFSVFLYQTSDIPEYILHLLSAVAEQESVIEDNNVIAMIQSIFKTINNVFNNILYDSYSMNEQSNSYLNEVLTPLISSIIEISGMLFEHLSYPFVAQYFLDLVSLYCEGNDLSDHIEDIIGICIMTSAIDEEDKSFIETDGNIYYDIAFDKLNYDLTPRIKSCQVFLQLYKKYGDEIIPLIGDIDSENKIRIVAEVAGSEECSEDMKQFFASLIAEVLTSQLDLASYSSLMYLCSKVMHFGDTELANNIFEAVITQEVLTNPITYILLCDIISNAFDANILIVSEEKTVEVCSLIKESEFYSSYNSLNVFSAGFRNFPALFGEIVNDYVQSALEIIYERKMIQEQQNATECIDSVIIKIIEMLKPCIQNCFDLIDFSPLMEIMERFASIDYSVEFARFFYIFYQIAFHQDAEKEIACYQILVSFLESNKISFNLIIDYFLRFLLIQLNKSPEHFIELYSDKGDFLQQTIDRSVAFIKSFSGTPNELSYSLLFIARIVTTNAVSIDEEIIKELFEFCVSKLSINREDDIMGVLSNNASLMSIFEFVSVCILKGVDADLTEIIGIWVELVQTNGFPTDYERALQVSAIRLYLSTHPLQNGIQELVESLNANQLAISINSCENITESIVEIQNLIAEIPFVPEGFVASA